MLEMLLGWFHTYLHMCTPLASGNCAEGTILVATETTFPRVCVSTVYLAERSINDCLLPFGFQVSCFLNG